MNTAHDVKSIKIQIELKDKTRITSFVVLLFLQTLYYIRLLFCTLHPRPLHKNLHITLYTWGAEVRDRFQHQASQSRPHFASGVGYVNLNAMTAFMFLWLHQFRGQSNAGIPHLYDTIHDLRYISSLKMRNQIRYIPFQNTQDWVGSI